MKHFNGKAGQKMCIRDSDSILKRLLYTHYALCFVYDSDKNRGYLRAKEFDEYLFKTNSELAVWSGISIPALRIARRYQFAVSYTHLDVYKRQSRRRESAGIW